MPERPQNPEIGSFKMSNAANAKFAPNPTTPPDPNATRVFPMGEGTDAVRRFIEAGANPARGSMADSFPQTSGQLFAPDLPPPPEQSGPEGVNLAAQIDDLQRTAEALSKSPEATYTERLKKHNITIDKAKDIVDSVLFKGEYQETFQVTQTHTVTFRSRMFSDQERALRALEQMSPQYPATMAAVVSKNNIASSLVRFAGKDFSKMAYSDKSTYVERLPEPLVRLLAIKLGKFDQMIMDIMDDGVIENF